MAIEVYFDKSATYAGRKEAAVRRRDGESTNLRLVLPKNAGANGWVLEAFAGRGEHPFYAAIWLCISKPRSLREAKALAIRFVRGELQLPSVFKEAK